MAEYRSKSYSYNTDKNMQIEPYPYYGPSSTTTRPPNGFTFHSASYSTASSNYYATAAPPPPPQPRNLKRSGGGSSSKSWSFNDPEFQRKRRVASYKVYSVEGKVKGTIRKSLRWLKNRYDQVVCEWR